MGYCNRIWCHVYALIIILRFSFASKSGCYILLLLQAMQSNLKSWENMYSLPGPIKAIIMLHLHATKYFYYTDFAEVPSSMTQSVELGTATPPFRCRHTSSDAIISWLVNDILSGQFSDIRSGSVNENGTIVYTLTIPAEPQYNGTVVECVAVFFDGSPTEVSPAATIFFTPTSRPPGDSI